MSEMLGAPEVILAQTKRDRTATPQGRSAVLANPSLNQRGNRLPPAARGVRM